MTDEYYFDQDLFDPLVNLLETEAMLYGDLVKVIEKKQSNIIRGDLNSLRDTVAEEQRLLQQAKASESTRQELVRVVAEAKSLTKKKSSLVDIINAAPEPYATQLRHLRKQIHAEINAMVTTNKENDLLINTSLNHIRGLIQLFLKVNDDAPSTYTPNGTMDGREIANQVVDYRI